MTKKKIAAIVAAIVAILAIVLVIVFAVKNSGNNANAGTPANFGANRTASGTIEASLNGTPLYWYGKESKAVNDFSTNLVGSENELSFETDTHIRISAKGQSSGKSFSADSANVVSDILGSAQDMFASTGIAHREGASFKINANAFDEGEVVLLSVEFVNSESILDEKFGKGIDKGYWAFTAQHSEETTTEPESSDETASESTEPADSSDGGSTASLQSTVLFNGFELKSYNTQDEALANATAVSTDAATAATVQTVVSEDVARVRLCVMNDKGSNQYHEYFIVGPEWSISMDVSGYAGQTIVLVLDTETGTIIPQRSTSYIAVKVP